MLFVVCKKVKRLFSHFGVSHAVILEQICFGSLTTVRVKRRMWGEWRTGLAGCPRQTAPLTTTLIKMWRPPRGSRVNVGFCFWLNFSFWWFSISRAMVVFGIIKLFWIVFDCFVARGQWHLRTGPNYYIEILNLNKSLNLAVVIYCRYKLFKTNSKFS